VANTISQSEREVANILALPNHNLAKTGCLADTKIIRKTRKTREEISGMLALGV
jgi:hypothetical protein